MHVGNGGKKPAIQRRISWRKLNYIPEGYRAITPYLVVKGGAKAIDYYVKEFRCERTNADGG